MNIDILIIAGVLILMIICIAVAAASGMLRSTNKETREKLAQLKARFSDDPHAVFERKSIRKSQQAEGLLGKIDGLIPRRDQLVLKLDRAGISMELGQLALIVGLVGVVLIIGLAMANVPLPLAITGGVACTLALPTIVINSRVKSRLAKFTTQFPDAIDMMVRGLKSGLPVSECITNVGLEVPDPTGAEFRKVTDQMRLGKTLEEALWDTADRLDTPDFKFFVISMSVQRETGGNLAGTLQNLSSILRQRQAMKLKVKALSSEAKASAWILGLLPFIVLGLIMMLNPEYGGILFTNPKATIALVGGLVWMSIGVFIMSRMRLTDTDMSIQNLLIIFYCRMYTKGHLPRFQSESLRL